MFLVLHRDLSVDLFGMTYLLMSILLGDKGAMMDARHKKVVDVEESVLWHGEESREFLCFCRDVIQNDLCPQPEWYDDLLEELRDIIIRLIQRRIQARSPPRGPQVVIQREKTQSSVLKTRKHGKGRLR